MYHEEGILSTVGSIPWTSNASLIDFLMGSKKSIFCMLEDQCVSSGSDEKLVSTVNMAFKGTGHLDDTKLRSTILFCVKHTVGDITYDGSEFIRKNKDVLRSELVEVVKASRNSVAAGCFEGVVVRKGTLPKGRFIANQFKQDLTEMMTVIDVRTTG